MRFWHTTKVLQQFFKGRHHSADQLNIYGRVVFAAGEDFLLVVVEVGTKIVGGRRIERFRMSCSDFS